METAFLALLLIILLLLGVHIGIALGVSSAIYLLLFTDFSLGLIPPTFFRTINSITLMAIPLFLLSGFVMERVGIVEKLFRFTSNLAGWLPAGAGVATMISCMIFSAISGSSAVVAGSMGVIAIPNMRKLGYPDRFSTGILAMGGTLGILIPPSITMIIFGIITETSIPKLFLAGAFPGFLAGVALSIQIVIFGHLKKIRKTPVSLKELGTSFKAAIWGLLMPVVVLGGIYGGIFTPTEAAAVAAFYAICYGLIVKKSASRDLLVSGTIDSLQMSAMIFLILGGAYTFSMVLTLEGIPENLARIILDIDMPKWAFLIAINIFYLIMGCFLDVYSCMLLTVPVVFPVITALQINPLHFAVFLTVNMEVAAVTPPVGFNLFVLSGVSNVPLTSIFRGVLPFIFLMLGFLGLVTWLPWLSTWLPALLLK